MMEKMLILGLVLVIIHRIFMIIEDEDEIKSSNIYKRALRPTLCVLVTCWCLSAISITARAVIEIICQ